MHYYEPVAGNFRHKHTKKCIKQLDRSPHYASPEIVRVSSYTNTNIPLEYWHISFYRGSVTTVQQQTSGPVGLFYTLWWLVIYPLMMNTWEGYWRKLKREGTAHCLTTFHLMQETWSNVCWLLIQPKEWLWAYLRTHTYIHTAYSLAHVSIDDWHPKPSLVDKQILLGDRIEILAAQYNQHEQSFERPWTTNVSCTAQVRSGWQDLGDTQSAVERKVRRRADCHFIDARLQCSKTNVQATARKICSTRIHREPQWVFKCKSQYTLLTHKLHTGSVSLPLRRSSIITDDVLMTPPLRSVRHGSDDVESYILPTPYESSIDTMSCCRTLDLPPTPKSTTMFQQLIGPSPSTVTIDRKGYVCVWLFEMKIMWTQHYWTVVITIMTLTQWSAQSCNNNSKTVLWLLLLLWTLHQSLVPQLLVIIGYMMTVHWPRLKKPEDPNQMQQMYSSWHSP